MSYALFVLSLIGLCAASIAAFVAAFKERSYLLAVFVPLIAICGSFIYFSYTSVLGYPAQMEWRELPNKITVIYFRVVEKRTITLWLIDKGSTRLVELPYNRSAENGLEGERGTMGQGTPVTFKKSGKKGRGLGQVRGQGLRDGPMSREGQQGSGGWKYRVQSRGDPIPGGALPPK